MFKYIISCMQWNQSPYGHQTAIVCLKDQHTPKEYHCDPGTPTKMSLLMNWMLVLPLVLSQTLFEFDFIFGIKPIISNK